MLLSLNKERKIVAKGSTFKRKKARSPSKLQNLTKRIVSPNIKIKYDTLIQSSRVKNKKWVSPIPSDRLFINLQFKTILNIKIKISIQCN